MEARLLDPQRFTEKIMTLWFAFLLGTLFHTQLALMPLFHGIDVAEFHTHSYLDLDAIYWLMLIFFTAPMLAVFGSLFNPTLRFLQVHFGLTLLYTVLNLAHLISDIVVEVPPYQITLIPHLRVKSHQSPPEFHVPAQFLQR
ncbi:MAG: hypothetical protein HC921_14305 [Synechococcaceae cyanobacterium SM2_3_1]|nr:hypothetical protein [Synechococcaceae cyanobacterium SM2_3_1]